MSITGEFALEVIRHHLRLFGIDDAGVDTRNTTPARLLLLASPGSGDVGRTQMFVAGGGFAIAASPDTDFCRAFHVTLRAAVKLLPSVMTYQPAPRQQWARLRTLHSYHTFQQAHGTVIVSDQSNESVWFWLPVSSGGILFVGTDLAGDLIRYRQGDPAKATTRPTKAYWGIAGERPNYLFEEQLQGEPPEERHADWWAMALAQFLSDKLGKPLLPLLPGGARGAIIITGDDDQAYLEKYGEQLQLLGETPITYFLHPLTRHSSITLGKILDRPWIDLGIHPDALENPERYDPLLHEQVTWYRRLTGTPPLSVRNHGFLNDGYWGHLPAWLREGIRISSNLPGLDGRALNSSLLPARVGHHGALTDHWSLLTAFGDGMVFALKMSDREAAERIHELARRVVASGVPGIIVLNLHPQNVAETRAIHAAAIEVIQSGFLAWTIRDCLDWFNEKDGLGSVTDDKPAFVRIKCWLRLWK